jgi:hypothetical protein
VDNPAKSKKALGLSEYRKIAEFRYRIRQFLQFSEEVLRANDIEPQQHQLLLELSNRLVARGAILKTHSDEDGREVLLDLTPQGERILQKLSVLHWRELQTLGPALSDSLRAVLA